MWYRLLQAIIWKITWQTYITSRLVFTAHLRPQFGIPAERRAQFRVPNVSRSRISEHTPFWIYEHAQCRVFERTYLQHAYVIPCQKWGRQLCYGQATARWWLQRARGACGGHIALDGGVESILALWRLGADFKQGSYRYSKTKFPDFPWLSQSIT